MAYYRAQILLEPKQHERLVKLAEEGGRSISDVAREVVAAGLDVVEPSRKVGGAALAALDQIRAKIRKRHGIIGSDPVAEARVERARDLAG